MKDLDQLTLLKKLLLMKKHFNFLYEDENYYYFINQKSFEQNKY